MRYRRLNWIFITAVFLLSFLFSAAEAAQVRRAPTIVDGVVQDVTSSSVEVNGRNYDISHAILMNVRGRGVTSDVLRRGVEVELFIENGVVTRVRVQTTSINQ